MADEKIRLSQKDVKTFNELKELGGVNFPVFKDNVDYYKLPLSEIESLAGGDSVVISYEAATYAIINEIAQSGKQVIIYYTGVDDSQFWTLSHKTDDSSYVFTWVNGNSLVKNILSSENVWNEEIIDLRQIKDNERDSVTDPVRPDNITDIEQLTFVRNLGDNANYTVVASEERTYGVLIPPPSMEVGVGKVPIYKDGNQIEWGTLDDGETIEHVLNLDDLDAENTTFNVDLIPNRNHAISFTGSSEQIPIIAIEIMDNQPYNIQIIGSCTLSLTGVEWWSDAVTGVTSKAEINVMNGRAIGVVIDV